MTPTPRETILALVPESKPRPIESEGLEGVYVREMPGAVAAELARANGEMSAADFAVELIIRCVCDQEGAPLFTDSDKGALREVNSRVFMAMVEAAGSANGMDAIEEAEGN